MNPGKRPTIRELAAEAAELRVQLTEANETLEAIRSGAVDALIVSSPAGERVFTLEGAETPYRSLVEEINQGALLLRPDGTILYANTRFAQLTNTPLEQVIGSPCQHFFPLADQPCLESLLAAARRGAVREELALQPQAGVPRPVEFSMSLLKGTRAETLAAILTDLTERKRAEEALRQANEQLEERVQQRTAELSRANERLRESELRFRSLFESSPDAVFLTIPDGRIVAANPAACAMFGMSEAEICRVGRDGLADPEDPRHAAAIEERLQTGRLVKGELNYVRRNGERFPAEVDSVVLPGTSARSFVILRDITERKRAEAALVASEQRYRLLFDRNPDGVFAVDTTGRFLVANPACETISGYPMAELLQKTFLELCAPDQLATALEHFQRGVHEGGYEQLETALVHQDGRRVEVWVAGEALVSEGQTSALYCTVKDITARKQAEQALARTRAELERHNQELEHRVQERTAKLQKALAEMEHFSYAIVHDMRAPLRALRGFAELAEQQCAGSQQTLALGYFDRIKIASKRMDNLICDSLNYSKTVREQLPSEPVELGNLLRDLVQTYPNLQPEKAEIRLEGAFPLVLGNEAALSQCFGNLLDNAVKFAKPNAPSRIRVWAEPRRSSGLMDEGMAAPEGASHQARKPPIHSSTPLVRIWVEDDGIGIPKNLHRRIFDMFQRGTNHHAGTGIGLAIVSKVVERMGGRVGVESQEGKGSRFWVELPAPL